MKIPPMSSFAERLELLMKQKGISNYRMAKDLSISEGGIRSWRSGRTLPRKEYLKIIANYLNSNESWLMFGNPDLAPSYKDDVRRISDKIDRYALEHPDKIKAMEKMLDIIMGEIGDGKEDNILVGQKKKTSTYKRKSA